MKKLSRRSLFRELPATLAALTIAPLVAAPAVESKTTVTINLDGKVLARTLVSHLPSELKLRSIR